jgi:signal transduction histidine kinase
MQSLTEDLAKGNLSVPVKAEKSKFLGRFLWGMDMLRETLESNKEKELALQKEKKTLILSLTHDIRTSLSAIRLYAKALEEDLYTTGEQCVGACQGIGKNVKEIEEYVNEITLASREDFLQLSVNPGEVYLSHVIDAIRGLYEEKLHNLHTGFQIASYNDLLLKGDEDRLIEVLQNLLENAIKYGDGKRISIDFSEEEDCRLITVRNSGCSLKQEELINLFDSFYRGSNVGSAEGSGLGLYISRQLMRKMDGEVCVEIKEDDFCATIVARKA